MKFIGANINSSRATPRIVSTILFTGMATAGMSKLETATAADPPNFIGDVSLYPILSDVGSDTDFTITLSADLPGPFSYFSFSNFKGVATHGPARFDRSEQNFRITPTKAVPVDFVVQGVLVRGPKNSYVQTGLSLRLNDAPAISKYFDYIGMRYRVTIYPIRLGANNPGGWALEQAFRANIPGTNQRIYFGGFIDQSFGEDLPPTLPKNPIVAEAQIGLRVIDQLHAVAEYRINQRRVGNTDNLAVGVQYLVRF